MPHPFYCLMRRSHLGIIYLFSNSNISSKHMLSLKSVYSNLAYYKLLLFSKGPRLDIGNFEF